MSLTATAIVTNQSETTQKITSLTEAFLEASARRAGFGIRKMVWDNAGSVYVNLSDSDNIHKPDPSELNTYRDNDHERLVKYWNDGLNGRGYAHAKHFPTHKNIIQFNTLSKKAETLGFKINEVVVEYSVGKLDSDGNFKDEAYVLQAMKAIAGQELTAQRLVDSLTAQNG